jgi:hypothetical protein
MSYELKTNTAIRIPVGPLVDPTDGKTAEVALTVADLSVQIYQMQTDGNAVVRTGFSPTASGGSNDMTLVSSSTDGMYDLEITAAQINWLGNGRISLYDIDGFLVHYVDIQVVSANYFDNKFGAVVPDVNVTQWAGTATVLGNGLPNVNVDSIDAVDVSGVATAGKLHVFNDAGVAIPTVADLGVVQTGDNFARIGALGVGLTAIIDDTVNIVNGGATEAKQDTLISAVADVPTVSEFNLRTLAAAAYTVVSDLGVVQTGDSFARIGALGVGLTAITDDTGNIPASPATEAKQDALGTLVLDLPTVAEFNARTLLAAAYTVVADLGVVQTGDNFARIGALGVGLTAITDDTGNIVAAGATEAKQDTLISDVADVPTVAEFEARSILAADYLVEGDTLATVTNLTNAPTNGDLTAVMKASVNSEVVDTLNVDTYDEPGDEELTVDTSLVNKIGYLYKFLRNKVITTTTKVHVYNAAEDNIDQTSEISDDGSEFTRGEFGAGD